ncbi:DUF3265 domain-containing protein [Vibrio parahaemolyticus]|nr:DUF3265 domain-containing protein [Vibrio parahaemolyticus]
MLTNCSRVIRHAWHFDYALVLAVCALDHLFGHFVIFGERVA